MIWRIKFIDYRIKCKFFNFNVLVGGNILIFYFFYKFILNIVLNCVLFKEFIFEYINYLIILFNCIIKDIEINIR